MFQLMFIHVIANTVYNFMNFSRKGQKLLSDRPLNFDTAHIRPTYFVKSMTSNCIRKFVVLECQKNRIAVACYKLLVETASLKCDSSSRKRIHTEQWKFFLKTKFTSYLCIKRSLSRMQQHEIGWDFGCSMAKLKLSKTVLCYKISANSIIFNVSWYS